MKLSPAKKLRMRHLIDESGAILAVPMDHGYSIGPVKGIDKIAETVEKVSKGGASCVIVQRGILKTLSDLTKNCGVLVHVSGSASIASNPNLKILTSSVEGALRSGVDGVSCHVNVGMDDDYLMMSDMAELADECDAWNLPLLTMMYARNNEGKDDNSIESLAHIARIAEESGADIVKVNMTVDGKGFDEVVQGIHVPVVIAGGAKKDDFDSFLEIVKNSILNGASGVSVGRNIFQSDNPELAMSKVRDVVRLAIKEVGGIDIFS